MTRCFSAVLVFQVGFSVAILQTQGNSAMAATALREEYDAVCEGTFNSSDPEKLVGRPDCETAKQALRAKQWLTALSVIHGAIGITCVYLVTMVWAGGAGALCNRLSTLGSLLKAAVEFSGATKINAESEKTRQNVSKWTSLAIGAAEVGAKLLFPKIFGPLSLFKLTTPGSVFENRFSCSVSAGVQFTHMYFAIKGALSAKEIQRASVRAAAAKMAAYRSGSRVGADPPPGGSTSGGSNPLSQNVSSAPEIGGSGGCNQATGNNYLSCIAKGNPKLESAFSALTADKTLNDVIGGATGGKTLGDLVKSFGDQDPSGSAIANHVAGAFGLPSTSGAAIGKQLDGLIKDLDRESAAGGGVYTSTSKSAPIAPPSSEPDLGKVMNDLLNQGIKKTEPQSTSVSPENSMEDLFRRLDLMTPDKIEASNISIFVRIAYRYRKKTAWILSDTEQSLPAPLNDKR